ncbi:MAG: hypothetical protein M3O36_21375, partial [Myxococcota bacterium]|nr:hypothetical protein [Myxococcota bacterium]
MAVAIRPAGTGGRGRGREGQRATARARPRGARRPGRRSRRQRAR